MSVNSSFPRIHQLPESVANQIAAGEVIERPASVVKELIENCIDAAATQIHIDIEKAGIGLIRVRDNGQGIHKDDLKLALQPHATSKLTNFSDLSQIASLGFRGEAIPSIASVSRFKLTSRLLDSEHAWTINNEFQIKPAAHEVGTTVEVQDLFYSTPGRRKFLKTEKTEYLHIQSLIRAISLSHFSTGIFVKHNEQSMFRLPACIEDVSQRVLNICGRSFLSKSVQVDSEKDGMRLWGWLGLNDVSRSQSDRQYFYVNGRMVRDKHIIHAIRLAYDDRIAIGRHPSFVLHLQLDPSQLDVNVHPAKSEVRFSEIRNVHDFIYGSLLDSLKKPIISITDNVEKETTEMNLQHYISEDTPVYDKANYKQNDMLRTSKDSSKHLILSSGKFAVVTKGNEQFLLDIERSRKLITEQNLLNDFHSDSITKRPILVSISIELKQDKLDLVLNKSNIISQWGFELEQISPTQISIRTLPSRLVYADAISLVNDLLDALVTNESDKNIANRLANHVNDAGTDLKEESFIHLINEICSYREPPSFSKSLPWRKLDEQALKALLDGK